jgi:hypothetical protein
MHPFIGTPYHSVDEAIVALQGLERHFVQRRDRRGVFATGYLEITRAIARHLAAGGFLDPEWSRRYLIHFANLYRIALLRYESGEVAAVPKSWRLAFGAARSDTGLVIQHLVLGINAHINHDLPLALVEIGIDPDRAIRYQDHVTVNQVLEGATAGMKHRVGELYAPVLYRLDRIAGRLDDDITNFSIPRAREHAWTFAVALTAARNEEDRALLHRALDEQAAVMARLVLASPTRHPLVLNTVRVVERLDALARWIPGRSARVAPT